MVRLKSLIPCGALALSLGGLHGAGTVRAVKVEQAPVLDGRVTEEAWATASPAGGFVQQRPLEGALILIRKG